VENEIFVLKDKGNVRDNNKGDVHIILQIDNKTLFNTNGLDLVYKKKLSLTILSALSFSPDPFWLLFLFLFFR
jgi:DnaJ-class molecular chaperone